LVKIGAKVVAHGRYVTFQMAEVAVPRDLFREILNLITGCDALAAGMAIRVEGVETMKQLALAPASTASSTGRLYVAAIMP
jgi:hypothetical protein